MADPQEADLRREIARLTDQVAKLNQQRILKIQNSYPRLLFYRFVSGLALGLGTVLGGSILLSLLALALSSIDFIPVIGEWATRIAQEMDAAR